MGALVAEQMLFRAMADERLIEEAARALCHGVPARYSETAVALTASALAYVRDFADESDHFLWRTRQLFNLAAKEPGHEVTPYDCMLKKIATGKTYNRRTNQWVSVLAPNPTAYAVVRYGDYEKSDDASQSRAVAYIRQRIREIESYPGYEAMAAALVACYEVEKIEKGSK